MPAIQMNPSGSQIAGQALKEVLGNFAQQQQQQEQQSKLNNALQQAQQVERSNLSPQEKLFEQSRLLSQFPEWAKHIQDQQNKIRQTDIQQQKANQPKTAAGGVTAQPTPPEYANKIAEITQGFPDATAGELESRFQQAGIPSIHYRGQVENRRREMEANTPESEFKKARGKAVSDFVNESVSSLSDIEDLDYTIGIAEKAIKGEITGPGVKALVKSNPYSQMLIGITPDEASLSAANKKLLQGTKSIFGSKPTEREIFLLLHTMLPSIGKTKEANMAGLNFIKRVNDMKRMRADIVNELTENGTKYVPDVETQVSKRMQGYANQLKDDLNQAVDQFGEGKEEPKEPSKEKGKKIHVKAPDGKTTGYMTQDQIDEAAKKNVIFSPI